MDNAPDIVAQVSAEPALDELMRRRPQGMTRGDRDLLVVRSREQRAAWELKQQAKQDKAAGIDTETDTPSEGGSVESP